MLAQPNAASVGAIVALLSIALYQPTAVSAVRVHFAMWTPLRIHLPPCLLVV